MTHDSNVPTDSTFTGAKKETYTSYQWTVFMVCWLGGIAAGINSSLFSVLLPHAMQEIGQTFQPTVISQLGSWILFLFLLGWMVGGFLIGVMGDRWGRVRAMSLSILLFTLFTGLTSVVQTSWHLAFCRFFVGIGVGGEMVSISILLAENWPTRSRAVAMGGLITSYQIGVFLSGLIAQLIPEWRMAFAVGVLPVVLAIYAQMKIKESEQWKQSCSRKISISNQRFRLGQTFSAPFKAIFGTGCQHQILIGSTLFGSLLVGYWAALAWVPTWIQSLPGATGDEKNWATMCHGFAAIGGCLLAGYLANHWGRRWVIRISFAGAFMTSAYMFLSNDRFSPFIYGEHALIGLFIGLAQAVLYIYLPELFPTKIRATAVGFCLNCGRFLTALAVLFVGTLVVLVGGYAYALFAFSCFYLIGLAFSLISKETGIQSLPE